MTEPVKTGKRIAAHHREHVKEYRTWLLGPTPVEPCRVVPKLRLEADTVRTEPAPATTRGLSSNNRGPNPNSSDGTQSARTTHWNEWNGDTNVARWRNELQENADKRSLTHEPRIWHTHARTFPKHSQVLSADRERHQAHGMLGPPHNEDRLMLHQTGRSGFASYDRIVLRSARPKDNRFRASQDPTLLGLQDLEPVRGRRSNGRHLISSIRPVGNGSGESEPESTNPLLPAKPRPPPPRCSYDPLRHVFEPANANASNCSRQDPMHVRAHLDHGDERLPSGRLRGRYKSFEDSKASTTTIASVLAHPQA